MSRVKVESCCNKLFLKDVYAVFNLVIHPSIWDLMTDINVVFWLHDYHGYMITMISVCVLL